MMIVELTFKEGALCIECSVQSFMLETEIKFRRVFIRDRDREYKDQYRQSVKL